MRARLQRVGIFHLAALAATVLTTVCVATSAEARRGMSSGQWQRYERQHPQERLSWSESSKRSSRPHARSAERRHGKRLHAGRSPARDLEGRSAWSASASDWTQPEGYDRPASRHRKAVRSGRAEPQSNAWASAPLGPDAPAYAYEPGPQTAAARIDRGREAAAPQPRRRLAAMTDTDVGSSGLVSEARRWLGTNPTHRATLWCGAFMNFVLERTGLAGTGSDLAKSFAALGQRVSGPQVGAIAVMSRRGGGHVGVVSGVDAGGNPIIISGNSHGRKVAEHAYPRGRVYAYVMP
jgi:uncharacterized protein (TIGR02594 family)